MSVHLKRGKKGKILLFQHIQRMHLSEMRRVEVKATRSGANEGENASKEMRRSDGRAAKKGLADEQVKTEEKHRSQIDEVGAVTTRCESRKTITNPRRFFCCSKKQRKWQRREVE